MKIPLSILFLLLCGCASENDSFNRGYVISKSHVESEPETSEPSELLP